MDYISTQTSFSVFDEHESLLMRFSEFQTLLESFNQQNSLIFFEELKALFKKIRKLSESFFDRLINANIYESNKAEKLTKKLVISKTKAKKYYTLQREMSHREKNITSKNKSLTFSLKKLRNIWKKEVSSLESSLKKQQKTHNKLSSEYNSSLELIEKEIIKTLNLPININKDRSLDTSKEFDELMKEISLGNDFPIDNSRISMEKNPGGWASEYESDRDSKYETDDIKNAIKVLSKANLIGDDNNLHKLNEFLNQHQGSESLELILQLLDINSKTKENFLFDDTTPMTSTVINENEIFQTIVSPGHKGPIFFPLSDFDQDSIIGIN